MSPYVYCAGNPVKYVDPDGNAPWDNHYVQVAQSEASSTGGKYSQWTGQNGCVYASVQTTSMVSNEQGGMEFQVQADVYRGTPQSQHNPVWNVVESFERAVGLHEEGHSDCANRGTITTADFRGIADFCEGVSDACDATGTLCIATGGGAAVGGILYEAGTVAGYVSDAINIGVDIYEGKYKNAGLRIAGSLTGGVLSKSIRFMDKNESDMFGKVIDKKVDEYIENNLDK